MTELEQKIQKYADDYYQGNEQISDAEYDALIDQLRKESPNSKLLPENQGIAGSDLKGVGKKYKLDITMGTLAKCNTDEQFKEWWSKHPHNDIVCETKLDGCLDKDTVIDTDLGKKTISDIVENRIQCKVKSFNFQTQIIEFTPVLNWMINQNNFDWYEIELENGKKLKVTGNHRVWLPKLHCWRKVEDLTEQDFLEVKID